MNRQNTQNQTPKPKEDSLYQLESMLLWLYASATFDLAHSLLLPLSYASATFKLVRADVAEMASYLEATSSGLITIALANVLTLNLKPLNP
jgi:hypothetical protein